MEKDNLIFVEHILGGVRKIETYVAGLSLQDFIGNELIQNDNIPFF